MKSSTLARSNSDCSARPTAEFAPSSWRSFKSAAALEMIELLSAPLLPKSASKGAAMDDEVRKRGTRYGGKVGKKLQGSGRQSEGAVQLRDRRCLRGRYRAHRHRGKIAAPGQGQYRRVVCRRARRGALALQREHPRIPAGEPLQSRAQTPAQAAAAPSRGQQADRRRGA